MSGAPLVPLCGTPRCCTSTHPRPPLPRLRTHAPLAHFHPPSLPAPTHPLTHSHAPTSTPHFPFLQSFGTYLDALKLFLVDVISLTKANCTSLMDYYQSLVLVLAGFKAALLLVVAAPVLVHCCKRMRQAWEHREESRLSIAGLAHLSFVAIFRTSVMLLFVAYVGCAPACVCVCGGGGRRKRVKEGE